MSLTLSTDLSPIRIVPDVEPSPRDELRVETKLTVASGRELVPSIVSGRRRTVVTAAWLFEGEGSVPADCTEAVLVTTVFSATPGRTSTSRRTVATPPAVSVPRLQVTTRATTSQLPAEDVDDVGVRSAAKGSRSPTEPAGFGPRFVTWRV